MYNKAVKKTKEPSKRGEITVQHKATVANIAKPKQEVAVMWVMEYNTTDEVAFPHQKRPELDEFCKDHHQKNQGE
jgi:hypothetical protein